MDGMKQSNPYFIEKLSQIKQQISSKTKSVAQIQGERSKTPETQHPE